MRDANNPQYLKKLNDFVGDKANSNLINFEDLSIGGNCFSTPNLREKFFSFEITTDWALNALKMVLTG